MSTQGAQPRDESQTPAPASTQGVREQVRAGYAAIAGAGTWNNAREAGKAAATGSSCCAGGGCCGPSQGWTPQSLAKAIGYDLGALADLPQEVNLGLSCGNPGAIAGLAQGEVVLDLGSGAGFDCFLAGPKVGARGRVIGVDMTPEMLGKARRAGAEYTRRTGLDNVEFRLGEIEHLPVADASVDVVISNCVLNLSTDKRRVWREIARVLRTGGRVAISDIALLRPLPEQALRDAEALVGCIAGAQLVDDMRDAMVAAGLSQVRLTPKADYVAAMIDSSDPLYRRIAAMLPPGVSLGECITSVDVAATKP